MALIRDALLCPRNRFLAPCSPILSGPTAGWRLVVRASAAGAATRRQRRTQNVEGEFFVDHLCIDCDTCRWMSPGIFTHVDGKSAVTRQPSCEQERTEALQALLSCPTNSIHTEKPTKKILEVQKMFPLPIDIEQLPGVYLCGYHSEKSYGAAPYLITHPDGNILVDSPRYTERLARNIEALGGAKFMFLTHKDDVADHEKWSERLRCERILHSGDVEISTANLEMQLQGEGPWGIGSDFELIYTPGHTKGSVCLYYKPLKVLFTGDHLAQSEGPDLYFCVMYNKHSVKLQLKSIRKLLDVNFEWILPGHGRRIKFRDYQEKNTVLESFLARQEPLYSV